MALCEGYGAPFQPPRPLMARPGPAASGQTRAWPAPVSPAPHPPALQPDSTDHERVLEIDQQALRNLRSFRSQHEDDTANDDTSQTLSPPPSSASSVSPRPIFNIPGSPIFVPQFSRRHSAPFAGRRVTPEVGMLLVIAEQLPRPARPTLVTPDLEFWWPFQPNGEVEMRVGIMTRRGRFWTMSVRLPVARVQSISRGSEQYLMPGSVLPVPGQNDSRLAGRRFSTGNSPIPTRSRGYGRHPRFPFAAQLINTQLGTQRLAVLRGLLNRASGTLREHDEIIMPMPYPSAWPETIQFIHTGNPAYLSEMVRSNLLNLGSGLF